MRHNEDGRRNKHNNHRNKGDNFESKHQQSDNEYNKHTWNIRGSMISDSKQHERSSISSPENVS